MGTQLLGKEEAASRYPLEVMVSNSLSTFEREISFSTKVRIPLKDESEL